MICNAFRNQMEKLVYNDISKQVSKSYQLRSTFYSHY